MSDALEAGFTLQHSLTFLSQMHPEWTGKLKQIDSGLIHGRPLSLCLKDLGFQAREVAQLQFAEIHGDFDTTLKRIAHHLEDRRKQRDKLKKTLAYPLLLLLFLLGMLFGMRWFVLPQLADLYTNQQPANFSLRFIQNFPYLILGLLVFGSLSYLLGRYYLSKSPPIRCANQLCRIPVVKGFLRDYYTSLFATEWGQLLLMGMEFRDIILIMTDTGYTPLMQAMASQIQVRLEQGYSLKKPLVTWQFLAPELAVIIQHGEMKGELGAELVIYGQTEWQRYLERIDKGVVYLQPLAFLLIALLIVSIYAGLLLPIYQGMEEFI